MVAEKYAVRFSEEGRDQLERLIRSGKRSARVINRARILLKTDEGWNASQVATASVSSTGQAMEDVLDLYGEPYDPDGRSSVLT